MRKFTMPKTLTHLIFRHGEKVVLHSLDFDIVTVANSEDAAWKRHVLSVKTYVEFGFSKGWSDNIEFRAPDKVWAMLTPDTPVKIMPPILIESQQTPMYAVQTPDEYLCAAR